MKTERFLWAALVLALLLTTTTAQAPAPTPAVSAATTYGYFTEPTCPNGETPVLLSVSTNNNGRTWVPAYGCHAMFRVDP